jgi:hypothetical protein
LIVELRACKVLVDEHVAQLLGYLRASRVEHGLFDQLWRAEASGQEIHTQPRDLTRSFSARCVFFFCAFCAFLWLKFLWISLN